MKGQCLVLDESSKFYDAIKKLDENGNGVLPIIDCEGFFVGLVTDGDVRRAILNKHLDLKHIINKHPYKLTTESTINDRVTYLKQVKRRHLPIVDQDNRLIEIFTLDSMDFRVMHNPVVIMAGGLGKRLGELTKATPKPMLHVESKPLLETILTSFIESGFYKFYISVNYKKEIIMSYFGDGSKWGVDIEYLIEDKRLGTAGSLSLITENHKHPLIVINGDVVTSLDYNKLLMHHASQQSKATMCVREYEHFIPYGVIELKDHEIVSLSEKPKILFNVNTGIYVLEPDVIQNIPVDTFYDMTTLFNNLSKNNKIYAYRLRDYWIDVGEKNELYRAIQDIKR
ncbi:NTP transferase domain-containing protein [bacterium]|nr:NTP transferase domain-containing protein [bacterium]